MKKTIIFIILTLLTVAPDLVLGQANANAYADRFLNKEMQLIAKPSSKRGWIDLNTDRIYNPITLFTDHAKAFGLTDEDQMRVRKVLNDDLGFTHYRFYQYNKGVRVEGAEYITHVNKEGQVYCANGKMVSGLNMTAIPALSEEAALAQVLEIVGADRYMWEDAFWMSDLKNRTGNPDTSYFPKGELVWSKGEASVPWEPENFRLAWKFDISSSSPMKEQRIIIDAATGASINTIPLESNCDPTTVSTIFNGTRAIATDTFTYFSNPWYRMQDDCQTATIHVRDWNSSTTTSNPVDIISFDNTWSGNNPRFGGTALWSAKRAYAYFLNEHSRASWDDADGAMDIYINAVFLNSAGNAYTDNASMSATGGTMKVGLGSSGTLENSWSTLDMISHEYAHAVTSASADLVYQGESGALNESFSDIFGEMSEAYTFGGCDYLVGEERTNGAIRSLSDPNSKNDPDTYGGVHWASTSGGDNGGVHTNSGVQNYWFHLLANGGSGTNDNGDAYSVSGIGRLPARDISYRSLTTYLISSDQYADAREGAIRAATDLYGSCSNEEIQTGKAWYAVGVGTGLALYDHVICGTVNTGIRQGINSVVGGGGCSNDASPTVGNVIYKAGTSFTFKPGFTATASGTRSFVTQMNPCSFAVW